MTTKGSEVTSDVDMTPAICTRYIRSYHKYSSTKLDAHINKFHFIEVKATGECINACSNDPSCQSLVILNNIQCWMFSAPDVNKDVAVSGDREGVNYVKKEVCSSCANFIKP